MSLKSQLDARVRRYRSKYFPKHGEVVKRVSQKTAKQEWAILRTWFWVTQRGNRQVTVYVGTGISELTRERYLIHKTCWLGRQHWHCIALKFPKETMQELAKLAEKDGLQVVTCTDADRAEGEKQNVNWNYKIIYDVPNE